MKTRFTSVLCRLFFFLLIAAVLIAIRGDNPAAAAPTNKHYYVAPAGSDSNPGTVAAPFKTIQHGINQARPGDTVFLRGGVYVETFKVRASGTPGNPITVQSYPGETAVVDGQYTLPAVPSRGWDGCNNTVSPPVCFHYAPLVRIEGSYVTLEGIVVRRSLGRGIVISSNDGQTPTGIVLRNNVVHDLRDAGLIIQDASQILVEGNEIYHSGSFATHDRSGTELGWPVAVNAIRSTNITYRGNKIHRNWGEGMSTGRGTVGVFVDKNEIYDNFALQIYVHRSHQVYVTNNLIYCTNHPDFLRQGNPSSGIIVNNETQFSDYITVEDVRITNNIVVGCVQNLGIWPAGQERAQNLLVAHNTFANATANPGQKEAVAVKITEGDYKNMRFMNNIIYQPEFKIAAGVEDTEIEFGYNLWLRKPPTAVSGAGDIIGDPKLGNPHAALIPGAVQADWYRPQLASPAVDQGKFLGILQDYAGSPRGVSPDIGAYEHMSGVVGLLPEKVFLPLLHKP